MKALLLPMLLASCAPAYAQTSQCAIRVGIVEGLADRYGERQVMSGINPDGTMVEMFANPTTGTWTALISQPNGTACIVAAGDSFDGTVATLPADL